MMRHGSLRQRIIAAFMAMTVVTCALFGFAIFLFAYAVEDALFTDALSEEIAAQQAHWALHGELGSPRRDYVRIHRDVATLPPDLRARFDPGAPRSEYEGAEGRHYHVRAFELPGRGGPAYAVAEVSGHLAVRPIRSEIALFVLILTAAILVVGAVIGYWLASRATAPLTLLAGAVLAGNGRAPDGQAAREVPRIDPRDYPANEIGTLARALAESFDGLRAFVEREKRFTRDASHELRTPVAVVRGAAELMLATPDLPPAVATLGGRIQTAAADMESTIDLLLTLAREEHAKPAKGPVRLLPLVEKAVLDACIRFDGKTMDVTIDVPADTTVLASAPALGLILSNLVNNVFQHIGEGRLSITAGDDTLIIADSGQGLPGDTAGHGLEPFTPGPGSSGTGLGLTIVRRLCESQGITFAVDCPAAGSTIVTLTFGTSLPVQLRSPGAS